MKVKVLKLGYAAREVTSEQGMTVDEAIRSSGMDGDVQEKESQGAHAKQSHSRPNNSACSRRCQPFSGAS